VSSAAGTVVRFAPTTLTGGTRYDAIFNFSGNSTAINRYGMGTSPPTDVQGCAFPGAGYVDDTTTEATEIPPIVLIVDNNPAIAGSSGGGPVFGGMVVR
jgi:hypothetical protein